MRLVHRFVWILVVHCDEGLSDKCNFGFECLCVTTMKDWATCPIWAFDACVWLQWRIEWHVQFGHLMLGCDYNEGLSASFKTWKLCMVNAQGMRTFLKQSTSLGGTWEGMVSLGMPCFKGITWHKDLQFLEKIKNKSYFPWYPLCINIIGPEIIIIIKNKIK